MAVRGPRRSRSASPTTRPPARVGRYIALLRAVNLGGSTQVDLSAITRGLEEAGFAQVRSVLNSGNFVLSTTAGAPEDLERLAAGAVERAAGRPVSVFVRSAAVWASLLSANPFREEAESDPGHLQVAFLRRPTTEAACQRLESELHDGERLHSFGPHAFVYYPHGSGRSKLSARRLELALGSESTSRNWNTVGRLAGLVQLA